MPTFAEMKSFVSDRLLDPSNTAVSSAQVGAALNESVAYWKFHRFWFNTAADSVVLTEQDPVLPVPDDFLVELPMNAGFVIEYNDMRYPLIKKNPRDYDEVYLANGFGLPEIYTLKAGVYYCYYLPDQAYTLRRWYLKDYDALVDDDDTNDFTDFGSQLIQYWALSKLYAELRQDDKMEAYYSARALDEQKNLGVRSEKANSTGHVTIHSYL